ncbi:hypothetical protein Q31b_57180 [Novipirellula aureliae]|uniref:Uncharacterized protein n=1 Tax=Novipirellula aureliae TaxID=2527966 RepID=A0A5C6DD94_9BACT|nr:hypothetical protein Q31b_57180 [Novipirellula aureliae]
MDDIHKSARRRHRAKRPKEESKIAYRRRRHFSETPFPVIKVMFDRRCFLLRGIEGVKQEWQWVSRLPCPPQKTFRNFLLCPNSSEEPEIEETLSRGTSTAREHGGEDGSCGACNGIESTQSGRPATRQNSFPKSLTNSHQVDCSSPSRTKIDGAAEDVTPRLPETVCLAVQSSRFGYK